MAKLTLANISSGYATVDQLNTNFATIETAFENTLSRDGTAPNIMGANLDMNGYRILNELASTGEGFVWEGSWATATTYNINNLVQINGNTYICVSNHVSTVFADNLASGYWELLVAKGADGSGGVGDVQAINNLSEYSATAAAARASIAAAKSGANSDITSLSGLTTALPIAQGGTGESTASDAFLAIKQNATETATGVVEAATTAEMSAGTANKFPDADKVKTYTDAAITSAVAALTSMWEEVPGGSGSVTNVTFFDLDIHEDVYCSWALVLDGVIPDTDNNYLYMYPLYNSRTSVGGASGATSGIAFNGDTFSPYTEDTSSYPLIIGGSASGSGSLNGVGTAAGEHAHAVATIGGIGSSLASGLVVESSCGFINSVGLPSAAKWTSLYAWNGGTERLCDGIRLQWSSGKFEATGTYKLYGLRR